MPLHTGRGCPGWQHLPIEVLEHIPSLTVLAPPDSMWLRACCPGQGHAGCIPLYLPSLPFLSHPLLSPLTSQRKLLLPQCLQQGLFVGETQLTLRHAFKSQPAPHPQGAPGVDQSPQLHFCTRTRGPTYLFPSYHRDGLIFQRHPRARARSGFRSSAECSPWSSLEAGGILGGGRKKAEETMKVSDP